LRRRIAAFVTSTSSATAATAATVTAGRRRESNYRDKGDNAEQFNEVLHTLLLILLKNPYFLISRNTPI
jgi:hypothetical protein